MVDSGIGGFWTRRTGRHKPPGAINPNGIDSRRLRGNSSLALLANDIPTSRKRGDAFIRTYLERDLPQPGINLPPLTLRRFWTMMLAHCHGQTWNNAEIARSLGVCDKTVKRDPDILKARTWLIGCHLGTPIKLNRSPKVTAAMRPARGVLKVEQLDVVCKGKGVAWQLGDGITAVPVGSLDASVTDHRSIAPWVIPTDQTCP